MFECCASQGTVGASGDLAPLSHLALGLIGEGMMWDPDIPDKQSPSNEVLQRKGIEPIRLEAKEGLAMINGTQMMTSITAEATVRAASLAVTADVACTLSIEALKGTPSAFEPCIHTATTSGASGCCKSNLTSIADSKSLIRTAMRVRFKMPIPSTSTPQCLESPRHDCVRRKSARRGNK